MPHKIEISITAALLLFQFVPQASGTEKVKAFKLGNQADILDPICDSYSLIRARSRQASQSRIVVAKESKEQVEGHFDQPATKPFVGDFSTTAQKQNDSLEWKAWNKAIADELFNRIKQDLLRIGPQDLERNFYCKVHWRINDDGRILVLQIDGPQSELFRSIVRSAADSMQRSSFTKFPEGSTKTHIKKITHYKFDWRNPLPGEPLD